MEELYVLCRMYMNIIIITGDCQMELVHDKPQVKNEEFINIYKTNLGRYKCLEEEVKHILNDELKSKGIKIHTISSRVKKLGSILDKIERKNFTKLEEINDIVGTRIVCLFLDDINLIGNCIRECFEVISEDNKIDETEVSSFGYMSLHFIAKIKDYFKGPRYDGLKDLVFEIQVRTISMDAWANISHYLDYKNEQDLPHDLKKDFHALSGLFYVADKHFQMFVKSSEISKVETLGVVQHLLSGEHVEQKDDLINHDSLYVLLNEKYSERMKLHGKLEPKNISNLITNLSEVGISKISELVYILDKTEHAFSLYESLYPPGKEGGIRIFNAAGVTHLSVALFDERYREKYRPDPKRFADDKFQKLIKRD
jgi:putative GTP pyrophosphokinase